MVRFAKRLVRLAAALGVVALVTIGALPAPSLAQAPAPSQGVRLGAIYATENKPITSGLIWRILKDDANGGPPQIIARSTLATPQLTIDPGSYVVHATYGFASG